MRQYPQMSPEPGSRAARGLDVDFNDEKLESAALDRTETHVP
jgi:hypothetical protein